MNKFNQALDELIMDFYLDAQDGEDVEQLKSDIIALITPKLKWKQSSPTLWKTRPGQGTFSRKIHLRENGKYQPVGNEGTFDELLVKRLYFDTLNQAKDYCNQEAFTNYLELCK